MSCALERVFARWALAYVLVGATGCSIIVDQSDTQCSSTADCRSRGPSFANSYCNSSQTCDLSCSTNEQCTATASDPWICRADQTCQRLMSEDCTTLLAEAEDLVDPVLTTASEVTPGAPPQVIWLGMLLPLDPSTVMLSDAKVNAADLARRDFNANANGLPVIGDGPVRHFAFVVCDDSVDPDRAARHLTSDLGVPAIIGPVYSDTLLTVATDVTDSANVVLVTPTATAADITGLSGTKNVIWRTCPSDAVQGEAMALVLEKQIASQVREELDAGVPIKLANVHEGDDYGTGLGAALDQDLVFNDASTSANGPNYLDFDYGDPTQGDAAAGYARAVSQVLDLAPHIIALVGTEEVITDIMGPIEQNWSMATKVSYRPYYLLSDGAYPRPELLQLVNQTPGLIARVLGTQPGPPTSYQPYTEFLAYYGDNFNDGTVPVLSTAATYDAVYLTAYAIAAVGSNAIDGSSLVRGLQKVVQPWSPRLQISAGALHTALDVLTEDGGASEDGGAEAGPVIGTSGPLLYPNPQVNGDPVSDIEVWCLGADGGTASSFQNSGLYFDPTASETVLQGQITNCN